MVPNDIASLLKILELPHSVWKFSFDSVIDIASAIDDLKGHAKKQYRHLAHKHHPDKGGNSEMFKELVVAYEAFCALNGVAIARDILAKRPKPLPPEERKDFDPIMYFDDPDVRDGEDRLREMIHQENLVDKDPFCEIIYPHGVEFRQARPIDHSPMIARLPTDRDPEERLKYVWEDAELRQLVLDAIKNIQMAIEHEYTG